MTGRNIAEFVKSRISGRMANTIDDVNFLCELAQGEGDHLEIGTLFGASAIAVALVKKSGSVYCIDPLNGYYADNVNDSGEKYGKEEDQSGEKPSKELLEQNARLFGVHINIIQSKSYPFPNELKGKRFDTVYIDGDHHNGMPLVDFLSVKDITNKFIIFDNYEMQYPSVMLACQYASRDKEWQFREQRGNTFVLERV